MGQTLMGGANVEGAANLLTPEQQSFLTNILGQTQGQAGQAYNQFLQQYNPEQFQQFYQQSFIDPAQQALQRQIIPGIKENFLGLDESGSSALNRALAQSATDLSSSLGQGILGQYNQYQQNRLGALSGLGGLGTNKTFEPIVSQQGGILGDLIKAAGTAGAGFAMSSRDYKENIRPLEKGLESIKNMKAYQYDYKPEICSEKDLVGVLVEDAPSEIVKEINGMKGIDVYGLVGLLVNCINELNRKVDNLENSFSWVAE